MYLVMYIPQSVVYVAGIVRWICFRRGGLLSGTIVIEIRGCARIYLSRYRVSSNSVIDLLQTEEQALWSNYD